jgi:hypothetical protein
MIAYSSRLLTVLAVLCFLPLLLSACGSPPVLESKAAAAPAGIDFSGFWQVRDDPDTRRMSRSGGAQDILIPTNRTQRSRRGRDGTGAAAQIFLEYGNSLKITQTDYGIFISYDRSVVEEFNFGENRLISIGPIEALRASGWEANLFVVETLDDSGTILYEAWHLESDDAVLVRDIRLSKGEAITFEHQQTFDRQ